MVQQRPHHLEARKVGMNAHVPAARDGLLDGQAAQYGPRVMGGLRMAKDAFGAMPPPARSGRACMVMFSGRGGQSGIISQTRSMWRLRSGSGGSR